MLSSNGAGRGGSSSAAGAARRGEPQVARVITSAAWDLRLKRCEVAKGDLNEVRWKTAYFYNIHNVSEHSKSRLGVDVPTLYSSRLYAFLVSVQSVGGCTAVTLHQYWATVASMLPVYMCFARKAMLN